MADADYVDADDGQSIDYVATDDGQSIECVATDDGQSTGIEYRAAEDGQFVDYGAADNGQFINYVGTNNGQFIDYVITNNGQIIPTTENTLVGPGQPEMAMDVITYKNMKDDQASQPTFKYPQAEQKSLLLTIPPEIRNMIFKLCLCHPKDISGKLAKMGYNEGFSMMRYYPEGSARPKVRETYELSTSGRTKGTIKTYSFRNLKIMQTCQAIYMEAARVLWGQQFAFHSLLQLQSFLLSDARFDLVRDIKVWTLDYCIGVNWMPLVCTILADKVKNLESLDVEMQYIHKNRVKNPRPDLRQGPFTNDEELKQAGVNLGFDIYSCMHPWVTQVVSDKGVDKLMDILRMPRPMDPGDMSEAAKKHNRRVHVEFQGAGPLTLTQRAMVKKAVAEEIVRLIDVYEKKP